VHFFVIYKILGHGSLGLQSEDSLYDFISQGNEAKQEMFHFLELVRLEYCSTDVMRDFCEHFSEITASVWAILVARLLVLNVTWKPFARR
jgi:hypothetical protein